MPPHRSVCGLACRPAYRLALQEWTRDRVPLKWAMTQHNLGTALMRPGERESGTSRLEQAVAAGNARLTITASAWPSEWVQDRRARHDEAQAEIKRRSPK
jgi:hypothetical protein